MNAKSTQKNNQPRVSKLLLVLTQIVLPGTLLCAGPVVAQPFNPFAGIPLGAAPAVPPKAASAPAAAIPTAAASAAAAAKAAPTPAAATAKPAVTAPTQSAPTALLPAPTAPTPAVGPAPAAPAAGAAGTPGVAAAPIPVGRPTGLSTAANPGVSLKFDNADIFDVLQVIMGDVLKLDYVIDPAVQGRVTLKSNTAVSMADIYSVLETALATVNIAIVRQGNLYKVTRDTNAVRDKLPEKGEGPASPVMQVIAVKFVQASQLVNTLRNFVSPQAAITNDPTNRYLIVADRQANVEKIVELVATLDVDYLQKIQVRLLPVRHGDPADLVKELDALFKTSGMFNVAGTDGVKVYFLPVLRMNAVLVAAANEKLLEAAERWLRLLDAQPGSELDASVHIYPVVNSNAAYLADLLRQLFGGSGGSAASTRPAGQQVGASSIGGSASATATGTQNRPAGSSTIERGNVPGSSSLTASGSGLGGSVQVIADELTNTLIIKASAQDFAQIRKLLLRLDQAARQVLIQVMVAEVTLNDTLQYGVEWWLNSMLSKNGSGLSGKLGLEGNIKPPTTQAVTGAGSGLNYTVFSGTGQVVALLNLLGQDTNVNVLSAPHVMASDGKVAKIEVGNDEPIITQVVQTPGSLTSSTTTSNSVQYRPTGILLEVKPSISASGKVALSVSQEVSSRSGNVSFAGSEYPNFSKRKVTSDVVVDDGKTLLIAGLIEDRGDNTVVGLPGLKDIPVVGALFGSTKKTRNKTELLMTITPYIVNDQADSTRLTAHFQESLRELKNVLQNNVRPQLDAEPVPPKAVPTAAPASAN